MNYDEWWEDFVAEHDEWKYADSAALRRAAFQAGAASRDAEVAKWNTAYTSAAEAAFRLSLERDQLRDEGADLVAALEGARKSLDVIAFEAGRKAEREDAERYRWLRDNSAYVGVNPHSKTCLWVLRGIREIDGAGFDEAVDGAIRARGEVK